MSLGVFAQESRREQAVDTGAIPIVTRVMQIHLTEPHVQTAGSYALARICEGTDVAATLRKHVAVRAGSLQAVIKARKFHPLEREVQTCGRLAQKELEDATFAWGPAFLVRTFA